MINQNMGRGLLLAGIASFFLVQAPRYGVGTFIRPGSGLFPLIVGTALLVIGLGIAGYAFFTEGPPLDFKVRNIAIITTALVGFAVISEYLNMLLGIVFMTTVASLASKDFSIRRTAAIAGALCFIAFAMTKGLGVQLPLY